MICICYISLTRHLDFILLPHLVCCDVLWQFKSSQPQKGKGGSLTPCRSFCIFLLLTPGSTGSSRSFSAGGSELSMLFHIQAQKSVSHLNSESLCKCVTPGICHLENVGLLHCSESKYGHSFKVHFVTIISHEESQCWRLSVAYSGGCKFLKLQCSLESLNSVIESKCCHLFPPEHHIHFFPRQCQILKLR